MPVASEEVAAFQSTSREQTTACRFLSGRKLGNKLTNQQTFYNEVLNENPVREEEESFFNLERRGEETYSMRSSRWL